MSESVTVAGMTESQPCNSPNPIVLEWPDETRETGEALEALARSATEAELAALVYAVGHMAIKAAHAPQPVDPRTIFTIGTAGAVLGNELAIRYGFDQDLMPAWATTLNRQMMGEG